MREIVVMFFFFFGIEIRRRNFCLVFDGNKKFFFMFLGSFIFCEDYLGKEKIDDVKS